ncbi:hypothetical protein KFK09_013873 [Dendrobium nobile]|uniref:Uncharacterized protein n=1 Tax=Dendrobium nobile TaxID=94219 RepID=A0A8T3BA44_DENNO|nr:hypothetical protein KFK09_013873 [Dendrobium nobile]
MHCLGCMNGADLCSLCLSYHHEHHAVQIRRYVNITQLDVLKRSHSSPQAVTIHVLCYE